MRFFVFGPRSCLNVSAICRFSLSHLGEPHANLVLSALAAVASVDQVPPDADAVVPAQGPLRLAKSPMMWNRKQEVT